MRRVLELIFGKAAVVGFLSTFGLLRRGPAASTKPGRGGGSLPNGRIVIVEYR